MLAHHPISGKPIRILKTEPQISSNNKTLLWVRQSFQESHRWKRWHCVVSEPKAVRHCFDGIIAAIIPETDSVESWILILNELVEKKPEVIILSSNKQITALQKAGFQHPIIIAIEEFYDSYPYLGEPVNIDAHYIEKTIICLAHILRMNRIVWTIPESEMDNYRGLVIPWKTHCDGLFVTVPEDSNDSIIPRTTLIQQYYRPSQSRRLREINTCLEKNIACDYIDSILLLNETAYEEMPNDPKLQTIVLGHRLTYQDVILAAQKYVEPGNFVVFSNSDIWFNETIVNIWRIKLQENRLFLALLRWEDNGINPPTIFGPRADSQDCWIVARNCLDFTPSVEVFGFPFGKSGCDNAITLIMMKHKFLVANPAYTIRTMHIHTSKIRSYDPKDVLYKEFYLYVEPTAIQFSAVEKNIESHNKLPLELKCIWNGRELSKSFSRVIHSINENNAKTACTMIRHISDSSVYHYSPDTDNLWTTPPQKVPLYNFKGGHIVTVEGLISTFKEIFIGNYDSWKNGWESLQQSSLTNSIHIPSMISISYEDKKSLSHWVLYYLPKALQIRKFLKNSNIPLPEFLVPQVESIGSFLADCRWPDTTRGNITVSPMMDTMNYYSEDVWCIPPTYENIVTTEDIHYLRSLLPKEDAVEMPTKPVIVFCVDDNPDSVCTRGWAEETADKICRGEWIVRYVGDHDSPATRRKAFQTANWIVGSGDSLEWIWYAPTGTTVMEFMHDSAPKGDIIHLAGASEQRYVLGLIKKEPVIFQRQNALLEVGRALQKFGFREMLSARRSNSSIDKPLIVLPDGDALSGIWNHCGDTFREMATIWAERDYVKLQKDTTTGYCWWGGIGQILLYDRPTPRWWTTPPPYQMALFGNCAPPGPELQVIRQSVWSFWPRSPRAIETLVKSGEHLRSYAARKIQSLFIGKVENGVQLKHRTSADWSKCVELFSMPIDSSGQAYPYTQKEYLDRLCNAQFGLCLPGFGPKCNREIEYFACGCVPIVTPGVDMKNYLVPPKAGLHYLVANTPEDVQKVIKSVTPEKWAVMSAAGRDWWRNYASAEGLFRLTWARIEQCRPFMEVGIPTHFPPL